MTPNRVRVWKLARDADLQVEEVIERLQRLGLDVNYHAQTVSSLEADRFWLALEAERSERAPQRIRIREIAKQQDVDTEMVLHLLRAIGVDVSHPSEAIWEFDARRLRSLLEGFGPTRQGSNGQPAPRRGDPSEAIRVIDPPTPGQRDSTAGWMPARRYDVRGLARRIFEEVRGRRFAIILILVVDLLAIPLALLTPIPVKIAVDSVLGSDDLPTFIAPLVPDFLEASDMRLLLAVALLQVLVVVFIQLQSIASYGLHTTIGERITVAFRARLFRHAQRLSLAHHYAKGPTDALYRVQYDAATIRDLLDSAIPVVTSVVMLVATVVITARISLQLAVVALVVMPVLFLLARTYVGRVRGQYRNLREKQSSAMQVVQETLSAVEVVKAFGREDEEERRFVERSDETVRARVRLALAEGGFGLAINVTTAVGAALVLLLGVRNVMSGALKLGELLVVMSYVRQLYDPLRQVSQKAGDAQNSLAGAERAFALLDEELDVVERPDARRIQRSTGRIRFEHVTFSYDGRVDVLRDVSFEITPGARVGVVGRTGAGKTTMVSLMMRFYDPTSGRILLDEHDLRDCNVSDVRGQYALVLQKPVLFSNSVAQNIRYARPNASFSEIVAAAKAADAHEFILDLPDGYDTNVGDQGMRLSGGQRQRISLARAFLKDAPILILDEPTSSVDRETEAKIMDALGRLMEGRTTIMIAHRLSTLDYCEALLELHDGGVRILSGRDDVLESRMPA